MENAILEIRSDLSTSCELLEADFSEYIGSGGKLPYYKGATTVVPKVSDQKLETANKSMATDITVLAITQTEVHNETGVTLTIGEV